MHAYKFTIGTQADSDLEAFRLASNVAKALTADIGVKAKLVAFRRTQSNGSSEASR